MLLVAGEGVVIIDSLGERPCQVASVVCLTLIDLEISETGADPFELALDVSVGHLTLARNRSSYELKQFLADRRGTYVNCFL